MDIGLAFARRLETRLQMNAMYTVCAECVNMQLISDKFAISTSKEIICQCFVHNLFPESIIAGLSRPKNTTIVR